MSRGIRRQRRVVELDTVRHAPKHQTAAAHVAAPDECGWIVELGTERGGKRLDILAGGDAAEKNDARFGREIVRQALEVAVQRFTIANIVCHHVDRGEFAKEVGGDQLLRR